MGRLMLRCYAARSSHALEPLGGDLMSPHPTHLNLPNFVSEINHADHLQSH